ncbi:MAG: redoxin domain-containing protein [Kordiimonas sp.]
MQLHKLAYLLLSVLLVSVGLSASPEPGKEAPAFTGKTSHGTEISLSDLRGKTVVLEWTNHDCPYVKKHYNTGNMQRTQRALIDNDAVWLSIISSAEGTQGYVSAEEANELTASRGAYASYVILDPTGDIGRLYAARTTPQMFLINKDGVVEYMGAIDDKPSTRAQTVKEATNYLLAAWQELKSGKEVSLKSTKPYGCSVKYAD